MYKQKNYFLSFWSLGSSIPRYVHLVKAFVLLHPMAKGRRARKLKRARKQEGTELSEFSLSFFFFLIKNPLLW
jgi:hypothetical protein